MGSEKKLILLGQLLNPLHSDASVPVILNWGLFSYFELSAPWKKASNK